MAKDLEKTIVEAVRALYRDYELARKVFDALARRSRDASVTNVETVERVFGVSRGEAVGVLQSLAEAGCGDFVIGRRGSKSRLVWSYSCVSVGQAAAGEATEVDKPQDPTPETDGNGLSATDSAAVEHEVPFTIAEAKRRLAETFGVKVENIEITVRA